ncbi:MAG: hypothetical protein ABIJ34_00815 [archaeon]
MSRIAYVASAFEEVYLCPKQIFRLFGNIKSLPQFVRFVRGGLALLIP